MEQNIKEKVLTEAATSVQDNQVKPLYEDLSITDLVMQVLTPTIEIIRILGDNERIFTFRYSANIFNIYEMRLGAHGKYEFIRNWVNIIVDDDCYCTEQIKNELRNAVTTMEDLNGSVRKELGYED